MALDYGFVVCPHTVDVVLIVGHEEDHFPVVVHEDHIYDPTG